MNDPNGLTSPDQGPPGVRRGEPITLGNEFSEVRISRIDTRNGARLLIESSKSGHWVALCPLEVEALTWQNTAVFSALIASPFGPLIGEDEDAQE